MKNIFAFCGSEMCTKKSYTVIRNKDYIKKDVKKGTTNCPDCSHALLWKHKITNSKVLDTKQRRDYHTVYKVTI